MLDIAENLKTSYFDRIVSKCELVPKTGCLIWSGYKDKQGYGTIWCGGKKRFTHRVMFEIVKSPIPEGLVIDPLCRNPSCINTDHMECVTNEENLLRGEKFREEFRTGKKYKKHCINGHILSDDNLYVHRGRRNCKECYRIRCREYKHKIREKN